MGLVRRIRSVYRATSMTRDRARFEREFYKEAVVSYPPRSATIGILSACTNRCIFCSYHSDDAKNGKSNVYNLSFKLSLQEFKRIVDMCYRGRVPRIHICGTGEPFLHSEILDIIDYSIQVYGSASLQTNFNKRMFEKHDFIGEILRRKDSISYITTDVLSGDPATHEKIKKGSCYEDMMSAMEFISHHSNIRFEAHYLITKFKYEHINDLVRDLASRRINCNLAIVNLHPHDFNEFTSPDSVYTSKDLQITEALQKAKALGEEKGIEVSIPVPSDASNGICGSFWARFQIWPVRGIDESRYAENVIVGGCNAVVIGNLKSLGYIFDYENIMDLWNNEHFVRIRKNLLKGIYPDEACSTCQSYKTA